MATDLLVANLLRLAKGDLDDARRLAAASSRNAIYHCEQAAEKLIRAVLASEGKHGGIRHLLWEMVDQVPDENPVKPLLRAIQDLGGYATAYRYPTSAGRILAMPGAAEFQTQASNVERVLNTLVSAFLVDLSSTNAVAGRPGPIRGLP
ncbi:MAG: HEPN domain-containing protein [Planctomycetia bacterium]|nr:HEPN domain-containing protein [Planctomycetia bacterium]